MEYHYINASDGCKLAFQSSQPIDPTLPPTSHKTLALLIHGFSGSSLYFQHNYKALSEYSWVIAVDLRGHGASEQTRGGFHVARLAADLKELVIYVKSIASNIDIVPVGCSIGAAILWTYVELFDDADFAGMVFVDQAPLQDRSIIDQWDKSKAHRGCFDEKSMLDAQKIWMNDPETAYKGLVADCLGYRYQPHPYDRVSEERAVSDEEFFVSQSRRCNSTWLARLLGDHTRYDHREACEMIKVPVLVMAGKRTGCFPLEGLRETIRRVTQGQRHSTLGHQPRWSVFDSGHWLFWEEPERFNLEIGQFLATVGSVSKDE